MNRKILEIFRIIFTLIVIILAVITIIMIIIKLSGHSPSETTIMFSTIGILIALQVVVISILFQIKEDVGNLKEIKRQNIEFQKQTIEKIKILEKRK